MVTQLQGRKSGRLHPGPFRRQEGSSHQGLRRGQQSTTVVIQKHRFPHLLVAGIARHLPQVKRTDSKKKFIRKTSVKPFVKYVNQNHVLPTRFQVNDFDLKDVKDDNLKTKEARIALKKTLHDAFTNTLRNLPNPKENEKAGHTKFFFSRLRF